MNIKLFMQALSDIKDEYILESADTDKIKENFKDWDEGIAEVPRKKIKHKKALMAAAIIAALLLAASIVAVGFDFNPFNIMSDFGRRIDDLEIGDTTEYRGITIVKGGGYTRFSTFEDFFEETDFDILYPSKLPDGIEIVNVDLFEGSTEGEYSYVPEYNEICAVLNDKDFAFLISTNPNASKSFMDISDLEIETVNELELYIVDREAEYGYVQGYFYHNSYRYYMQTPTREDLMFIIKNLKEYEE